MGQESDFAPLRLGRPPPSVFCLRTSGTSPRSRAICQHAVKEPAPNHLFSLALDSTLYDSISSIYEHDQSTYVLMAIVERRASNLMNKHIQYWLDSADHDLDVAESLFENAKYDWCLFIAHLVLEKTLKAFYVNYKNDFPPRTHDLVRLSEFVDLEIDEETRDFLDSVNTFNISTRYPDEKLRFYNLCTKDFAADNFARIKEIRIWILQKMHR